MRKAIVNMKNYNTENRFQDALIIFVIKNFAESDEEHKYRRPFMTLD